jgi:FkbM family methyltransferase
MKNHKAWKFLRAIKAIRSIRKPSAWGPFVETAEKTSFDYAFGVTWSQGGEDLALRAALKDIDHGRYIDVGAHHPTRFSVTRDLYQCGWSGINIEANPNLISEFERKRKRDVNIWACVGTKHEYTFNIFSEPAISTVSNDWKNRFLSEGQSLQSVIQVPGISLEKILEEHSSGSIFDLLCIDAEGSDLDVLRSANFENRYWSRPSWLLLESEPPVRESLKVPAIEYALSLGYEPYVVLSMSTLLRRM